MIGRMAASLGWKPHAPIVVGLILLVLGVWQGGEPLIATFPPAGELATVTRTGRGVVELNVQSSGLPRFLRSPLVECRTILDPGDVPVLYRSNLPNYRNVCDAFSGEVSVAMWPTADNGFDRTLAWGVDARGIELARPDAVIAAAKSSGNDRVVLGAILALAGLALIAYGAVRWSKTPREGPIAR